MFESFSRNEAILDERPFLDYEVQFNLFHRIIEGREVVALKTKDNNAIALQNPGNAMWLWINEALEDSEIQNIIEALCIELKAAKLNGISGKPEFVKKFADIYSKLLGISCRTVQSMEAYKCIKVEAPNNVKGELIQAKLCHINIVAHYCAGFLLGAFGKSVTKESQMQAAENMIKSGNLFLWKMHEEIKSMANIAHRSKRYARINDVYTPVEFRNRGYASALVSELSLIILNEGLIPMLYADVKNPYSNKAYRKIGYKECGRIDQIAFIYKKDI
jgi:predicted GNAT family acetyltransferase